MNAIYKNDGMRNIQFKNKKKKYNKAVPEYIR